MATLHTVNKSPFATRDLESCLAHARDGDSILMIEDGIYGGLAGTSISDAVAARAGSVSIYVLSNDMAARGMSEDRLIDGVKAVDYAGFVDLVVKNDLVNAWL